MQAIINFLTQTGFYMFSQNGQWKCLIMIAISFVLMYLAIVKGFAFESMPHGVTQIERTANTFFVRVFCHDALLHQHGCAEQL